MQSTSWETLGWKKHKLESRFARRNINNLRYADDTTLMAESEEELKSLLMKVKEEREKVGLKPNIQKTKIMASIPITSWQTDGETLETVADFIFLGSKITADGDCSNEIKRCLLLRRKVMTNLDSILKSRDITLATKAHLGKAMIFPVVTYGCEGWIIKKAEYQRIYAFELWCWRKLLRVPWTARRSNQSILKEISPGVHWKEWCWSWNSNNLATSCEELTHLKRPWCLERLRAGGERDDRGWDGLMASLTQWTWVWVYSGSWWWTGEPGVLRFMGSQRVRHDWATELNWTEHIKIFFSGGQTATKIKWNETQGSVEPSVKKYPKMSYIMKTMGAGAIVSLFKLWYWHLFKLVLVKLFNLLFLISYYLNGIIFALKLSEVSYEFFLCDRCGQKHYVLHLSWGS